MEPRLRRLLILSSVILALGFGSMLVMRSCLRGMTNEGRAGRSSPQEDPLQPFGEVLDFSFTERSGRAVTRADLAGKVWVANFFFTSCAGICPVMTRNLARLQDLLRLHEDLRFVSLSCDPVRDTPEVLATFAARYEADATRWLFLTGPAADMQRFATDSLELGYRAASEAEVAAGEEPTMHSDRFLLIDRQGRLRASYHGTDDADVARLRRDLGTLLAEAGEGPR